MSDFLTNLALRSSHSADLIRPRLPSLFESVRPPASLLARPDFSPPESLLETTDDILPRGDPRQVRSKGPTLIEEPSTQQAVKTPLSVTQHNSQVLGPVPTMGVWSGTPQTHHLPGTATTNRAPAIMPQPPRAPEPAQSSLRSRDSQGDNVQPTTRTSLQPLESPPVSSRFTGSLLPANQSERPSLQRPLEAMAADRRTADSAVVARIEKGSPDGHVAYEHKAASRGETPLLRADYNSQPESSIQPRLEARSGESKNSATSSLSKPSEPSIQVTIGRIEVRATQQQLPAQQERSASPVMSLDEYLRKKRAGA